MIGHHQLELRGRQRKSTATIVPAATALIYGTGFFLIIAAVDGAVVLWETGTDNQLRALLSQPTLFSMIWMVMLYCLLVLYLAVPAWIARVYGVRVWAVWLAPEILILAVGWRLGWLVVYGTKRILAYGGQLRTHRSPYVASPPNRGSG